MSILKEAQNLVFAITLLCICIGSCPSAWGESGTYVCDPTNVNGSWKQVKEEDFKSQITWSGWEFHLGSCSITSGSTQIYEAYTNHGWADGCYSHNGPDGDCPIPAGWTNAFCPVLLLKRTYEWRCSCNLNIGSFSGDKSTFNPSAGEILSISGSLSETFNNPLTWTVSVAGWSYSSTGTSVSNLAWDGKTGDGKIAPSGTYTVTLSASVPNGGCLATRSFPVTIIAPPKSCPLNVYM